jgi:hypothetical protein
VVTPDEPSPRAPQHTPVVTGAPVAVPPETNALPESLGAALSELLQLARYLQEERSRSAPAHQAATHRERLDLTKTAPSPSGAPRADLDKIATLIGGSARTEAAGPERVVHTLRTLWLRAPKPTAVTPDEWEVVYHRILGKCLQEFYTGP